MVETLERVYASALFELCVENDSLSETLEEMLRVGSIFSENEEYIKLLMSPLISDEEKHDALDKAFGGRLNENLFNFLCVLTDKGRIGLYKEIFREFHVMYNRKMNILEVTVVTSQPISERLKDKLVDKLSSVSGKKIIIDELVDKTLLGGIIIRYADTEIDASVKGKLDKLKKQIDSTIA